MFTSIIILPMPSQEWRNTKRLEEEKEGRERLDNERSEKKKGKEERGMVEKNVERVKDSERVRE